MTTVSTSTAASASSTAQAANTASTQQIAGNFDTFLQLLTTQLQNQDPLDPMDTSQFTEQLVEFASVEQQINENTNLQTLISLQQTSEATQAMQLIGSTVTVNSTTGTLSNATGQAASWSLNSPSPGTGAVTITSSSGQVAYTGTTSLSSGNQTYTWNGVGNNGVTWPDGAYTLSVSGNERHRLSAHGHVPDLGHCDRGQCQPKPAADHRRRPELSGQLDSIDHQ
jgi:flagellar basal-body rod modification protein FlgD